MTSERTTQDWLDSLDRISKAHREEMDQAAKFTDLVLKKQHERYMSELHRAYSENQKLRARIQELENTGPPQ